MGFLDDLKKSFDPPATPPADKDALLAQVRELAKAVDGYLDDISNPEDLLGRPEFERGVAILDDPVFTAAELLELSTNPPDAIWQMGVVAAGRRPQDPDLVAPLLVLYERGFAWQKYFVTHALNTHAPLETSLAGEIMVRLRKVPSRDEPFLFRISAPVLAQRVEAGETPAFGNLLNGLDGEALDVLDYTLKEALDSPLAGIAETLKNEFDTWRATFTDESVLQGIGRVHKAGRGLRRLVIPHPALENSVRDAVRALEQDPPRTLLVTGEHGVGKTTVVQQIAESFAQRGWIIFEASGADLIAGQSYIGEFEARIRQLVAEIGGDRKVLWYIPDFQTLSWVGRHAKGNTGALDLLYPYLESGEITVIGELTASAYQKLVQDMPRLIAVTEVCPVAPLNEAATLQLAGRWAESVAPEDDAPLVEPAVLTEAWVLARSYLRDREAPGCLLDFLDQTRKALVIRPERPVRITRTALIDTLTAMTGLPRGILDDRETLDPAGLKAHFDRRILGQPEAVTCLVERITLIKAGLTDPSRPPGVFLFAGPTGTGKTEIAKALASFLFGSEERLLRYDMSEFQSPDSLERLVGDGRNLDQESLTLKIRKQPFAVVLLDEFEKAHPKVWDLFLQVFDDGRLTDPLGRTSDFRHAIIILTSNLGGQAATGAGLGFDKDGQGFRTGEVDRAVSRAFRPEFINRLDRVVVFRPFTREIMRELLEKELRDVQERRGLRTRPWEAVWEDSALEFLLDKGFSPTLGARPLKRAVERYLLTPIAELIVRGGAPEGDRFLYVQAGDGGLSVEFIDPEADEEPPEHDHPGDEVSAPAAGNEDRDLASIALNPAGTPADLEALENAWSGLMGHVESAAWSEAKTLALSMTSVPDFWTSPERHTVLGEVEYRERIETGLQTVGELLRRLAPAERGAPDRIPRRMLGQAADRLRLLDHARRALQAKHPWEAFIVIDDKPSPGDRASIAPDWPDRLRDIYLAWGKKRKMRIQPLVDAPPDGGRSRRLILAVSGYAAYDILRTETGLHVWEEPDPRRDGNHLQRKAMVRVLAQPEDRIAETAAEMLALAREIEAADPPTVPTVARIYRERPDPLVKDRSRGWRTGNLGRVLAGDFDLLGDCAAASAEG